MWNNAKYRFKCVLDFVFRPGAIIVLIVASLLAMIPLISFVVHGQHYETKKLSTYEFYSLTIAGLTLLIYTFTLLIIAHQVRVDHERRRKQATIEHIEKTKAVYLENDDWLEHTHGGIVDPAKLTHEDIRKIKDLLASVEYLATGVMTGIFDLDLLDRVSGAFFRRLYRRVEPYVKKTRMEKSNTRLYIEFERLADAIDRIRKEGRYSPNHNAAHQANI